MLACGDVVQRPEPLPLHGRRRVVGRGQDQRQAIICDALQWPVPKPPHRPCQLLRRLSTLEGVRACDQTLVKDPCAIPCDIEPCFSRRTGCSFCARFNCQSMMC
jgi:hypothetical protein